MLAVDIHIHRMTMTAQAMIGLEYGHVMVFAEQICGPQT